jgi:hypothetical protein
MRLLAWLLWAIPLIAGCRSRLFDEATDGVPDLAVADLQSRDLMVCPSRLQPSPPTPGEVQCGFAASESCPVAQGCCGGLQATDTPMCLGTTQCHGPQIRCDGPEDCAGGMVCCVTQLGFNRAGDRIECAASCDFALCHSDADCPAGQVCFDDSSYFRAHTVGSCGRPCG